MSRKHRPPIGASPGALAIPPGAPPPRITVMEYGPGWLREQEIADPEALRRYAEGSDTTWVDVKGLGDEAKLRKIGEIFGIHPLALADAVNLTQRPKSMLWDQQQLVIAHVPIESESGALSTPQVCLLIGRNYLLTFQERPFGFFEPVRQRLRDGVGQMRTRGPDYLAWALVDTLVDHYYPVVESHSAALDRLEDAVLREATPPLLAEVHRVRRQIAALRRVGGPQREAISELMRDPSPFVSDAVRVYLRDTYDHISHIMEMADASREAAVGIVDLYLSSLSHRTAEVIRVLTLMTSIFIPLTFVVGVYGMNFHYMPELRQPIAYPVVMVSMLAIALGMIFYFRRRGWIGRGRKRRRRR